MQNFKKKVITDDFLFWQNQKRSTHGSDNEQKSKAPLSFPFFGPKNQGTSYSIQSYKYSGEKIRKLSDSVHS